MFNILVAEDDNELRKLFCTVLYIFTYHRYISLTVLFHTPSIA